LRFIERGRSKLTAGGAFFVTRANDTLGERKTSLRKCLPTRTGRYCTFLI